MINDNILECYKKAKQLGVTDEEAFKVIENMKEFFSFTDKEFMFAELVIEMLDNKGEAPCLVSMT